METGEEAAACPFSQLVDEAVAVLKNKGKGPQKVRS